MSVIEPDTKDWTWVLQQPCPECGYVAEAPARAELGALVRANAALWPVLLAAPDAVARPEPGVWSVLEYACHVRDVHRVFDERVGLMLDQDDPLFANWDQDETALAERYDRQDPALVATELVAAAESVAAQYDAVPADAWQRRGRRSNGSEFTVESLGRYHLHDLVHHAHDVRAAVARSTVAAYDDFASAYREGRAGLPDPDAHLRDRFAAALAPGARVLEIGSGPGRDARALEDAGLSVRRTDVSERFVELLRAEGHEADVLDPLGDDLDDPRRPGTPYDGVWASASLLHVARADLPEVLRRLAAATRTGGVLHLDVKEGEGEAWSTHGSVAAPRRFTYWSREALDAVAAGAGWRVEEWGEGVGSRGERWIDLLARRS
ncbi:methyltransferase domain-containing protein [Nocardioides sp. W7]|uniref:methyltransferase domain-containing protein n=1 Tax=Nocardioides sp. W7 TaxID=2931390 RepID=UPI001FCFB079|nr:methyltransferase domain-containing protein [Nocardioides sp. W7]